MYDGGFIVDTEAGNVHSRGGKGKCGRVYLEVLKGRGRSRRL
jgi:hypothetical protein